MKKWLVAIFGITIVLVLVVAVPNALRATRAKAAQPCSNNLMRIDGAKQQWAIENKAKAGDPVTAENILPYLGGTPTCNVSNGKYIVGKVGDEPKCTVHGTFSQFKPDHY
jgi:hypothetical protein